MRTMSRAWHRAVERELAKQEWLRARITDAERKLAWWNTEHMTVLQRGGRGWPTRVGRANLWTAYWWDELRQRTVIFNRRVIPELP